MTDLPTIRAAVLAEVPPSTKLGSWQRSLALVLVLHAAVVVASLALGVAVLHHFPLLRGSAPVPLGLAIVANVLVAMAPSAGRRAGWLTALLSVFAATLHVSSFDTASDAPFLADADCALAEVAVATIPLAAMLWLMRHFATRTLRSGAAATAAGLSGLLVLDLACPAAGVAHVLAFHLAPGAVLIVIGITVRRHLRTLTHVP